MNTNGASPRTALVTGGGRGIGRSIAEGLAADGLAIVIVDLRLQEAEEAAAAIIEAGGKAIAVEANVVDSASVAAAVHAAEDRFGHVDVLVNNAGWDDLMPFLDTDEAFWDLIIDINFKGPLRFIQLVLPGMIERKHGRIINIGSDAGRVGSSLESVYSGAKGGLIAFTKTIAREHARHGVTANVVCPGPTDTPFMAETMDAQGNADAVLAAMVKSVPMRRLAAPEEVATAVRFFATDEAGYVTGQTLSVSGGLTMA
ncbi:MAG: 2-hydroxycyclohexanecarboxyl-CoA dehydrogenase [Solirubrobacteraceae bacterium]|jgi:2-hydroxycyclohexanecarboxyl-CoA dehydrogenase|nr:2-hydroxycyclohexanecarboxyl-CoA dehydrogenase [Solirubrobacteraceae bacterium]